MAQAQVETGTADATAGRYTSPQIEAARAALVALALPEHECRWSGLAGSCRCGGPDNRAAYRFERIALAVARLTVKQVGGPALAYPALLWLVDRGLFAAVMGKRQILGRLAGNIDAERVALAAGGLVELCVLATWSDGSARKLPEVVSDLADAIWAIVDQGEIERAGELLGILLDGGLIDLATGELLDIKADIQAAEGAT